MGSNTSTPSNQNDSINKKGYIILGAVGEGGFGKVNKVKDKTTNEQFAIKETPYLGEEGYDRAMKEVANGAALNHINVVKFNEYFVDRNSNKLFITMELCDYNLSEWFTRNNTKNRSYSEGMRMFREIARGIQYIHDHNIIHRDLKPANVLIKNNVCKIADFGFSKADVGLTSVLGTPLYASPEQANGLWCEKSTDIYPLGLIMFEFFITFDNDTEYVSAMIKIQKPERVLPEKFFERHKQNSNEKFKEVKDLLLQMLASDPTKRLTIKDVLSHPFLIEKVNPSTETTQQNNDSTSVDNELQKIVELLRLLQLFAENNGSTKKSDSKSDSDASNKTVVNTDTDDSVESSDDDNSTALSSVLSRASLIKSKPKCIAGSPESLTTITQKHIASQSDKNSSINSSDEKNSLLTDIVVLGMAKRNSILEMLGEQNNLILNTMKCVDTLTKQLYDSLLEEISLSLQIISEGKSIEELPENIIEHLADVLVYLQREKKRIRKLKQLENVNRVIVEAINDKKVHNKVCDNYNTKMLCLVTTITGSGKQEPRADITEEQSLLNDLQRSTNRDDLIKHLVSLVNYLKTKQCSEQNYVKVLETVLMVSEKILNNRNGTLLLSVSEALYLLVKNNKFKSNTDEGITRKVITETLNLLHLKSEETHVTLYLIKTLIIFNIPEDIDFEYNRVVNIVIHNLDIENVNKSILQRCFYLLYYLTGVKSKRHIIGDEIGMKAIIKQIRERIAQITDSEDILRIAWSVLWNISDENAMVCENFWKCDGLECFKACYASHPNNLKLIQAIFGVLANFVEWPQLRHLLLDKAYMKIFVNHLEWKEGEEKELCFTVGGILSHLLLVDTGIWNRKVPDVRTEVQTLLNAAIPRWNVKTERSINYNSFKPFQQILLSDQSPNESKYWAIWELANLTYVNASKYCPYLEVNNLLELVDSVAKNTECPTNLRLLALTVMQQYESYNNNNK